MILQDIKNKLEEIDENVFYGAADKSMREKFWNFIVFGRTRLKTPANKTGYTDGFIVSIFREEFIPDGLAEEVIEKVCEINGMKLAGTDSEYDYVMKPNTDVVAEVLSIEFIRARKKV